MTPHSRRRRRRHRPTVRSVACAGVFATSFVSLSSIMVGAAAAPVGPVDVGAWSDPMTDDALASLPVSPGIPPAQEAREESGIEVPTRSGSIEDAIEHRARPVVVTIPSLGVTAPVGAASVEPLSGQLALLPDAATVVWYRHGPSPGQDGSAVLAGHVDWNGRQGAFFALDTLPPGAEILDRLRRRHHPAFRGAGPTQLPETGAARAGAVRTHGGAEADPRDVRRQLRPGHAPLPRQRGRGGHTGHLISAQGSHRKRRSETASPITVHAMSTRQSAATTPVPELNGLNTASICWLR